MTTLEKAQLARKASLQMCDVSLEHRNAALNAIAEALQENKESIQKENLLDIQAAEKNALAAPLLHRLKLSDEKFARMIEGIFSLTVLPDPLERTLYAKELTPGLDLYRVSCPIGVIGVIFESRPDALVQISSLCLKSGNAVLLKGGSEAERTNTALAEVIAKASAPFIPAGWIGLLHSRQDVTEMMQMNDLIDLIIPRGSNQFVRYIMKNSEIPVLGHSEGLCHVYIDNEVDQDIAVNVTVDSKTQNVSVCNAAETLLIHHDSANLLPVIVEKLLEKGVLIKGDEEVRKIVSCEQALEEDWQTEYLDRIISIRIVNSLDEAIEHINHYSSRHTDSILTSNKQHADLFMRRVRSADVFWNCSTRFADGYLFGLGAEVGIATGMLHARGPMGMEGLCTYQYRLYGSGQCLADLNAGKYALTHKDIPLK